MNANTLAGYVWDRWEDFRNGLYVATVADDAVVKSTALLCNPDHFFETATEMLREWPNSAYHNLSNMWSGRNAWVGQASCCYSHGATAAATRVAWGTMSNDQQRAANRVAVCVRERWERNERDAQAVLDL